ncbi:SERPINB8 [Cervus elaphus hippelaphus]|uniref:SERPINB8 n=1 Tax=Cervus elaphus hippelaphus TaxID=46360 RepID=A0A212C6J8_CEREH|nr:SERPINB8 [Cervus elaphus hippelaphus]
MFVMRHSSELTKQNYNQPEDKTPDKGMDSLSVANSRFCFDVFKELSCDHMVENVLLSPLSLLSALAVVLFGARGNSASQMEKCEDRAVHSLIQALLYEISKPSHSQVRMASGLFAEKAHPFLLSRSKSVQMMRLQGHLKLGSITEPSGQVLELPDVEDHLSMVIILPSKDVGLGQVTKEITHEKLNNWISSGNMKDTAVVLHLPQLRLEGYHEDLAAILTALGMVDVFDRSRANLSGIIAGGGLGVSKIIHKAMLEVNESGSEFTLTNQTIKVENPEIIKVDHPFLFFILHKETKMILFYGRVSNP